MLELDGLLELFEFGSFEAVEDLMEGGGLMSFLPHCFKGRLLYFLETDEGGLLGHRRSDRFCWDQPQHLLLTACLQHLLIILNIIFILATFQRVYLSVCSRFFNFHFFNHIFTVPPQNLIVIYMVLLISAFEVVDLVLPV